jgi:hypothetical protein
MFFKVKDLTSGEWLVADEKEGEFKTTPDRNRASIFNSKNEAGQYIIDNQVQIQMVVSYLSEEEQRQLGEAYWSKQEQRKDRGLIYDPNLDAFDPNLDVLGDQYPDVEIE